MRDLQQHIERTLRVDYVWGSPRHRLNRWEYDSRRYMHLGLWRVLDGSGSVTCLGADKTLLRVAPGDFTLLSSWVPCTYRLTNAGSPVFSAGADLRITMLGSIDICSLLDVPPVVSGPGAHRLGHILANMHEYWHPAGPGAEALPLGFAAGYLRCAFTLVEELVRMGRWNRRAERFCESGSRLLAVIDYMNANLETPACPERMAELVHLSPSRFSALFREQFGLAPVRYHLRMRLNHAADRLLASSDTLETIAADLGFHDAFHLSRQFKGHFHVSPSDYRAGVGR